MKQILITILTVLALTVPAMAQDEAAPSFFGMLSKEDTKEAFERMRAIPWENVTSTHTFDENELVRAVVEDDKYTYFAFAPGPLPVVYPVVDGIDNLVDFSYLKEVHGIAVKQKADKWSVRIGDQYVCVTRKAAQ